MKKPLHGKGALVNPHNRFDKHVYQASIYDDLPPDQPTGKVQVTEVFPKTIVNPVPSPDLPFDYSMNPYQGCEHGCSYCYARPTHEYWGFNAGNDFESRIMVKKNAPQLLEKFFQKKNYLASPIVLSGNTDCYQPIERQLKITREILEKFLLYKHPVAIITKNALVLRDLDILEQLNALNLIRVNISITSLNEVLRRQLEPRTSTAAQRLNAVQQLSAKGIPVNVMMAPIIPMLNSSEVLPLAKAVSEAGAKSMGYNMVRLNQSVLPVFTAWLEHYYPDAKDRILGHIHHIQGGSPMAQSSIDTSKNIGDVPSDFLNEQLHKSTQGFRPQGTYSSQKFGERRRGTGKMAESIKATIELAKKKYFSQEFIEPLSTQHFNPHPQQFRLDL
ncbi:MAG: PA0069 family radical SAM protein [Weeksellaceae bacterium]|nr:PA0069 family radical SAM protein [Weeksellaceae bacterium]